MPPVLHDHACISLVMISRPTVFHPPTLLSVRLGVRVPQSAHADRDGSENPVPVCMNHRATVRRRPVQLRVLPTNLRVVAYRLADVDIYKATTVS
jgi:hypothetical protein